MQRHASALHEASALNIAVCRIAQSSNDTTDKAQTGAQGYHDLELVHCTPIMVKTNTRVIKMVHYIHYEYTLAISSKLIPNHHIFISKGMILSDSTQY